MEPEKKTELTPEQEAEALVLMLEHLGIPREAIEEYKAHLREQGPRMTFEWHRDKEVE